MVKRGKKVKDWAAYLHLIAYRFSASLSNQLLISPQLPRPRFWHFDRYFPLNLVHAERDTCLSDVSKENEIYFVIREYG